MTADELKAIRERADSAMPIDATSRMHLLALLAEVERLREELENIEWRGLMRSDPGPE